MFSPLKDQSILGGISGFGATFMHYAADLSICSS